MPDICHKIISFHTFSILFNISVSFEIIIFLWLPLGYPYVTIGFILYSMLFKQYKSKCTRDDNRIYLVVEIMNIILPGTKVGTTGYQNIFRIAIVVLAYMPGFFGLPTSLIYWDPFLSYLIHGITTCYRQYTYITVTTYFCFSDSMTWRKYQRFSILEDSGYSKRRSHRIYPIWNPQVRRKFNLFYLCQFLWNEPLWHSLLWVLKKKPVY